VVDTIELSGDHDADMAAIAAIYKDREALYPDLAAPIKLAPPREPASERRKA
jgi:hypothetical protein